MKVHNVVSIWFQNYSNFFNSNMATQNWSSSGLVKIWVDLDSCALYDFSAKEKSKIHKMKPNKTIYSVLNV